MAENNEREAARDVCERPPITQAIKGGEKSICWSCLHWDVCFVKENQPCVKCSRYISAADVRPVVRGIWEKQDANLVWNDVGLYAAAYKRNRCGELNIAETNYCPNCGADMRENEDRAD